MSLFQKQPYFESDQVTSIVASKVKNHPDLAGVSLWIIKEGRDGSNDHRDQRHALLRMRQCVCWKWAKSCTQCSPQTGFEFRVYRNSLSFDNSHTAGSGNIAATNITVARVIPSSSVPSCNNLLLIPKRLSLSPLKQCKISKKSHKVDKKHASFLQTILFIAEFMAMEGHGWERTRQKKNKISLRKRQF